jgi:hypothetical protein
VSIFAGSQVMEHPLLNQASGNKEKSLPFAKDAKEN